MATGFVFMWLSGVFVSNIEGVPFFVENDRQGVLRDLHKSVDLTLLGLLLIRFGLRLAFRPPALPKRIGPAERQLARLRHFAVYATVVAASWTGLAIADVHKNGNASFGMALPQIFPTSGTGAGFWFTPAIWFTPANRTLHTRPPRSSSPPSGAPSQRSPQVCFWRIGCFPKRACRWASG